MDAFPDSQLPDAALLDRAQGCLVGLGAGDALGVTLKSLDSFPSREWTLTPRSPAAAPSCFPQAP